MGNVRKYNCDDGYFSKYNLHSCYWAGFIAADGYITKNNRYLELSLNVKDLCHLKAFANNIEYDGPITNSCANRPNEVRLRLTSPQMVSDLITRFNVVNCKTYILSPPPLDDIQNKLAYIVGYIDGDGYISSRRYNCARLTITGHGDILAWIKNEFDDLFSTNRNGLAMLQDIKHVDKRIKRYSIEGVRANNILCYLNSIQTPKLARKWEYVNQLSTTELVKHLKMKGELIRRPEWI